MKCHGGDHSKQLTAQEIESGTRLSKSFYVSSCGAEETMKNGLINWPPKGGASEPLLKYLSFE